MHVTAALRRPSGSPLVRRALALSGLAAGLWLAGSATSSAAADDAPPPLAPLTAPVQDVADGAGSLLPPATTTVEPVVAPVAEATVAPVARPLAPVTAPVVPVVAPVLPAPEPVLPSAARDLVEPVRASIGAPFAAAVLDGSAVPSVPVPALTGGGVADPAAAVLAAGADGAAVRTGVVVEHLDGAPTAGPAPVPGGNHVPVPRPAVPSGAPAPAAASGPSSPDQQAADLPPAARLVDPAALYAAADDARDAAADRAFDPSVAPD